MCSEKYMNKVLYSLTLEKRKRKLCTKYHIPWLFTMKIYCTATLWANNMRLSKPKDIITKVEILVTWSKSFN